MTDTSERQQIELWIKNVCKKRDWTINQWAHRAGVPPQTIYRFRSGQHKTISTLNMEKLAEAATRPV